MKIVIGTVLLALPVWKKTSAETMGIDNYHLSRYGENMFGSAIISSD